MKDDRMELTPKLRFPEFEDGPAWEERKLGDVISTITPPKKLPTTSYRPKGSIPIVDQSPELVCGWTDDTEALIESTQPVIVFGDHTCVLKLVRGPFAQGADGIKIFHSEPLIDTEYLFHNLSNRPLVMEDYKRHFSILKERRVHYPGPRTTEQRKIAACLTSLDEWIAADGRKLEALRTHKKGLMQQLFPRQGESRPRFRFPEFRDGAEWEEKMLGNEGTFLSSLTGKAGNDFDHGEAKFIPYMNVFSNTFVDVHDLRVVDVAEDESQNAVMQGDVFFTVSSETPEDAGMASVLLEPIENCYLNSFCALFRFDAEKRPNLVFLGYLLRTAAPRSHLSRGAQGATRYNIS
ncbi:MAG TPA: restriction endonuclease subunit S, partial [Candidatus Paceibacterota bacterium]|nr:restriction endonuclease subunit S [Candidatus Paceibacterota bacterium]